MAEIQNCSLITYRSIEKADDEMQLLIIDAMESASFGRLSRGVTEEEHSLRKMCQIIEHLMSNLKYLLLILKNR